MRKLLGPVILGLLSSVSLFAQFGPTGTTTLQVVVATEAAIQVDTATTNLTSAGSFADFTGSTDYTYKIRTSQVGGTGAITVQITSDFAPAGGPSVAAPPSPGDSLDFTCTAVAPATGCAGTQAASTVAATNVATFGADARSALAGNGGNSVDWTLTNDPQYATGTYNATATFTISAT
jgi:hypothetical protein